MGRGKHLERTVLKDGSQDDACSVAVEIQEKGEL